MSEDPLAAFLEKRDAILRAPTAEGAEAMWRERGFPPPVDPTVPLAAVHKARLQWIKATDAMLAESHAWLIAHDYEPLMSGFAYTPETRDAERAQRGLPPLKGRG